MIKKFKMDCKRNEKKFPSLFILFFYRLGNHIYYLKMPKIARILILLPISVIYKFFFEMPYNNQIPFATRISGGLRIRHPNGIIINDSCKIGENCTIFHQVTIGLNEHHGDGIAAQIGNNVYIGCGSKIIGNIVIEDNVKIGANAVVVKNVSCGSTVISSQKMI